MKNLLLLLLIFGAAFSMEQPPLLPQRGQKRWRQSVLVPKGNQLTAKIPSVGPRSAFELLPDEIKNHILSFLTTARGATKRARLDNAAENIRTLFRINTQFKPLGDDPQIIEYLITELANRYADGNKVAAAIALGTESSGRWLKSKLLPRISTGLKWMPETEAIKYDRKIDEQFIDAASNGRINVLKFLREFVPFYTDLSWPVALNIAVRRDQIEVVRFILDEPLIQDRLNELIDDSGDGISLLTLGAIRNNQEQIVDMLLRAGANVDTNNTNYDSPFELAIYQKNPSLVQKLIKYVPELIDQTFTIHNSEITPLKLAINTDNVEIVKSLLEAGALVNLRGEKGTALKQAQELSFKKNSSAIIKLLNEYGAK